MEEIEKKDVRPDGYQATDEEVAQQEEMIERKGLNDVAVAENATTTSTCKESLQVGNIAKMREALEYLRDASREFHHLILNSKHNEICDKYKYPEVVKIRDAIANAGVVLAEPVRNCDRQYENGYDVLRRFTAETGRQIFDTVDVINWLIAEAKGETR